MSIIPISALPKGMLKNKNMKIKVEPMEETDKLIIEMLSSQELTRKCITFILEREALKIDKQFMDMK